MPQAIRTFIFSIIALTAFVESTSAQQTFRIAKIEFEGLNRSSTEETFATTGLKIGDTFEEAKVDAAAQRLIDSGLFKNVAYHTRVTRDQMTITFQVEEAKTPSSQVVFDNFIWFTDTELIGAVRREVPSFSGTAPDNGDMVERITKALQRFLHENQIEATVNYMASQDSPSSPTQEHVFSVIGVPMPICKLHFAGTKNVGEEKLIEASKPLFGSDYSSKFVGLFVERSLVPIYRERGMLKAAFAPAAAKPEATSTCKAGVAVELGVDEGVVYKWDKAEWTGVNALNAQELTAIIGMQSGQTANGVKLDQLPAQIQEAYARKGYLLARARSRPEFNDAAESVMYKLDIAEGPQFRMGKLIVKGFPSEISKALGEKWRLKSGDIFDDGYLREFASKQIGTVLRGLHAERLAQGKPASDIKWNKNLNRDSLTVDVTFELAN